MIKKCLWMFLLATGLQTSWGFALLGPLTLANGADNWQTAVIGYDYIYTSYFVYGGPVFLQDIGGVRNIGQGYRRNVPVIYYTYDANFLDYFGSNGVAAVDSAMAIMNNLTNADHLDLTQFPMDSQDYNYQALSLYLTDVKSVTLHLLVEQMGLADPERFTWTLQDRVLPPGLACPDGEIYLVTQRNLEVTNTALDTVQYSAYVNNVLYTYSILEYCAPPDPLAITLPQAVDPEADQYTAVADNDFDTFGGLQVGGFYSGLTRDDVAGLKYLMTTNNINREMVTGSLLFNVTTNYLVNGQQAQQQEFPANPNTPSGFGTFNLGTLIQTAAITPPAQLPALFPGLVVNTSQNYFIVTNLPTVTTYFANPPAGSPYGSPLVLVTVTNYTPTVQERYVTTFANIVTNFPSYSTNTPAILQTITTGPLAGSPVGSPSVTITNNQSITLTNQPSGSYYILPSFGTNVCPAGILYTILTNVIYTTNVLTLATTNVVTATNTTTYSSSQNLITWYTNYTYVTYTVTCGQTANPVNLYQGIGKVQFIRRDYDSLLGQFFQPVSIGYSMVAVTNSAYVTQHFDRTIAAPEILFTGANDAVPSAGGPFNGSVTRNITYDASQILAGEAGPGVINPVTTISFNTLGSAFLNGVLYAEDFDLNPFLNGLPTFPDQATQTPSVAWASYDDSTNAPVLYPNGQSIANLANQMLMQISPASLPNGTNGVPYLAQFTVSQTRLTPPLSWSATGLPPGLTLTNNPAVPVNGATIGVLSGTPIDQTGGANSPLIYDVTITLTDQLMNSVQWFYPITIQ